MRFGLGPVFAYERLIQARRWQTYAARSFMVASLLVAMMTIASSFTDRWPASAAQRYAKLGESYFYALIGVELALVMLAAPAATAGAICLDRARGNLAHVMATDLSDSEIVLGKLAARLYPVMGLVACTLPVMAISTLLGGIDPTALTLAFAIIVTVALLGCAIALALSVWARKPHEVILTTYAFWLVVLMVWPVWFALSRGRVLPPPGRWTLVIDPFYLAFAPYSAPGRINFWDYASFFAVAIGSSSLLVLLAVRRMRPVTTRQASEAGKEPGLGLLGRMARWLPGPSLDGNPVLWREWHRSRPSLWMTILVVLLGGTTGLACCVGAFFVWRDGVVAFGQAGPAQIAGGIGYVIQLTVGLLMLSALAPLSLSEERQRGSLDVVSATPLSTWAIVLGKWWGTFRLVPVLAIGPGLMAFALATAERPAPPPAWATGSQSATSEYLIGAATMFVITILAHGAAITSIGLALATWMKRQVRAIATSVCVFVLIAVGWPIFAANIARGSTGLFVLSPLFVAIEMDYWLSARLSHLAETVWWIGFWDVGVAAFAVGLLWLTARTFDLSLGRIPERARTSPVLADVIVLIEGTTVASFLYIAVTVWVLGIASHSLHPDEQAGVLCFLLVVMLGLLLLSAVAPLSISAELRRDRGDASSGTPPSATSLVLTEWWRLFRLLLLLAAGPSLTAFALATAPTIDPDAPTVVGVPFPAGGQAMKVVPPNQAATVNAPGRWELPPGERLWTALMLVMTMLAFGALTIGAGLALGTWIKRRDWAVAASIGLYLPVAVVWPTLGMAQLFTQLFSREPQLAGLGGWAAVTLSLVLTILLAVFILSLTIRTLDRRSRPQRQTSVFATPLPLI